MKKELFMQVIQIVAMRVEEEYFHIDDFSTDSSYLDKKEDVSYTFGNIRALYGILSPSDIAILGQGFALISFNSIC